MSLGMLGKYERLDVLGHGVSGIVYLAKDTLLNKQVALKEVDVQSGDMRRFLEEARVMDRLRHPNIVAVNGVDRIDGKVVIDMEYVRGHNLQQILRQEGRLPLDRALDIAAQTLDALDYAHRMQTVHRDIKPANILVTREGSVKLVDFGLAEILSTNAYAGGAGTYAYMAPEDFGEIERSDSQSDIWAVGITLYEMLTEQRPFQVLRVKDPFAWKRALENELPTPIATYLPDAPPQLQAIFDRALAREKRDRYQTAGEFRDALLRLRNEGVQSRPSPRGEKDTDRFDPRVLLESQDGVRPLNGAEPASVETGRARRTMPLVVADVNAPAERALAETPDAVPPVEKNGDRKRRMPFAGRKGQSARMTIDPDAVYFGSVRKGDLREIKIQVRVTGLDSNVDGRIVSLPAWMTAHPMAFDRARQTLTLTAHSERAWETGDFQDNVCVETKAGRVDIPVHLTVLKPRRTFGQVALWYVPLFAAALFPALSVALSVGAHRSALETARLVPSASVASGLLAIMLLLISVAAELGMAERIACGVMAAAMGLTLGISLGAHPYGTAHQLVMQRASMTAGVIGAVIVLQLMYLRRWKLWAVALACLSLLVSSAFLHVIR